MEGVTQTWLDCSHVAQVLADRQVTGDSYANVAHSDASRPQIELTSSFGFTKRLKNFGEL